MSRIRRALGRHPPARNKREMELAALRVVVLTGMLAVGAVVLWPHLTLL